MLTQLLLDFERGLYVRDACYASDDSKRMLAAGDYNEARKWARKHRIALQVARMLTYADVCWRMLAYAGVC
jgi:hypothetical protein